VHLSDESAERKWIKAPIIDVWDGDEQSVIDDSLMSGANVSVPVFAPKDIMGI